MDISKLDFRGAAEAPQFVQFLHPVTGEPLQDGDVKIGAMVRGYQSRTVQKAIGEIERDELQGGEKLESVEDIQRRLGKQACIVTVELIGLERGGKPLTSADFAWFYDHTFLQVGADGKDVVGSFAQQALDKSKRQADFFAKRLKALETQAAQWGWLHTVPDDYKKNRMQMNGGAARGIIRDLPGAYLMEALWNVGPSDLSGHGEIPISWQSLDAYAKISARDWQPWELEAIMAMSKAYVSERRDGKSPLRIEPVKRSEHG